MHILRLSECLCEYFNYASFSATEKKLRCIYTLSSRKVGEELNVQQRELKVGSKCKSCELRIKKNTRYRDICGQRRAESPKRGKTGGRLISPVACLY